MKRLLTLNFSAQKFQLTDRLKAKRVKNEIIRISEK